MLCKQSKVVLKSRRLCYEIVCWVKIISMEYKQKRVTKEILINDWQNDWEDMYICYYS